MKPKIYEMNDYDYVVAESFEQALQHYKDMWNDDVEFLPTEEIVVLSLKYDLSEYDGEPFVISKYE